MDARLQPILATLEVNTRLFRSCLQGVDDEQALRRVDDRTNHLAFLATHLVGARAYLCGCLGGDGTDPFAALVGDARRLEDVGRFPTMAEALGAWDDVARRLRTLLQEISVERLDAEAPARFPIADPTVLGMVAFLMQHDAYHIGQMALLRKHLGYDAMAYGPPEDR